MVHLKIARFIMPITLLLLSSVGNANDDIAAVFNGISDKTPGCAVGVVKEGKLVYQQYVGQSSLRYQVPINQKTRFNIGSISKHITAALILQLENEGELFRADTLRKYYPNGPRWFKDITLYHLLHHQSGLPDYLNDKQTTNELIKQLATKPALIAGLVVGQPLPRQLVIKQIVDYMSTLAAPSFNPGEKTSYSNTGYLLLASIAEQVTGVDFKPLVVQRIFRPLGMSSTTLADLQSTETPWHATGYRTVNLANNEFRRTRFNFSTMGDGGVITTLPDLAKWVAHLMDPKVDRAFWLAMLNPIDRFFGPAPQFKFEQYVNGLIFTPLEVGSFYFHNGRSTSSMQSHMSFIPELKLGYLQMCNFDHVQQPALAALIKAYG